MDLGKKFRKSNTSEEPTDLDAEMEEIKAKYEKQMAEMKEKQRKQQVELARQKEQKEQERKEREEREKIEQERRLIEERKEREEHLKRETEKVKKLEKQQQEKAKKTAELNKLKDELKDHPNGCRCPSCDSMREQEALLAGQTVSVEEVEEKPKMNTTSRSTKSGVSHIPKPQMPKFKKPSFNFKLPSRKLGAKPKDKPVDNGKTDAKVHSGLMPDLTVLGIRLAIGISFIAHGLSKLNEDGLEFGTMLQTWGLPAELALPIAYIELLAGMFITIGLLTRLASLAIGVIMIGAIFLVKGASALIGVGGVELDVIILACVTLLGVFGPGRISLANKSIKGLIFVRFLH